MTTCSECPINHRCCRPHEFYIHLTDDEQKRLSTVRLVKEDINNVALPVGDDGRCVYQNRETHECMIYALRPKVCADFQCSEEQIKRILLRVTKEE